MGCSSKGARACLSWVDARQVRKEGRPRTPRATGTAQAPRTRRPLFFPRCSVSHFRSPYVHTFTVGIHSSTHTERTRLAPHSTVSFLDSELGARTANAVTAHRFHSWAVGPSHEPSSPHDRVYSPPVKRWTKRPGCGCDGPILRHTGPKGRPAHGSTTRPPLLNWARAPSRRNAITADITGTHTTNAVLCNRTLILQAGACSRAVTQTQEPLHSRPAIHPTLYSAFTGVQPKMVFH